MFLCCEIVDSVLVVLYLISMGGAIAVQVAASETIPSLIGLAVIDVVEGKVST